MTDPTYPPTIRNCFWVTGPNHDWFRRSAEENIRRDIAKKEKRMSPQEMETLKNILTKMEEFEKQYAPIERAFADMARRVEALERRYGGAPRTDGLRGFRMGNRYSILRPDGTWIQGNSDEPIDKLLDIVAKGELP